MRLFLSLLLIVASLTAVGEINDYKAISLLKEGFEYISDGKPDKAIESLTEATRYTIDKQSLSLAYRGMGHAYALYYTQARMIKLSLSTQLEYAIKAEECYRKGGSVHQAMGEQVHQAQLYLEMGEKDKGKKIFSSVIEKSGNDTTCTDVKIKALYMLSDAEADDENYARAIPLAEDAYTLAAATGRRVESRIAATMLGNIYRALKNVEKLEHWESVADSLKSDSDAILPTQNTFSRTMSGTFQELVHGRRP